MARRRKVRRIAALTAMLTVLVSCDDSTREYPGEILESLPTGAVGVVSVGGGLGVKTWGGQTLVFAFDENGDVVGRLEGGRIDGNQVLASKWNIVTASSDAVTTLTATSRIDFPIDEHSVQAMSHNPQTGSATIWFDSGQSDSFVSVSPEGGTHSGTVPGVVRTSASCGDRHYAVVEGYIAANAPLPNQLYEITPDGEPVVRGAWNYPSEFKPAARASACSADEQTFVALYTSDESRTDDKGGQALTLVRINVSDGSRSETALVMPGFEESVRRTMTIVGDRLYWVNQAGDVLSVPVAGPPAVELEWTIPEGAEKTVTAVNGTTLTTIGEDRQAFTQYDLLTGARTRDPIELPWLKSIVGSPVGNTVYGIASVADLRP